MGKTRDDPIAGVHRLHGALHIRPRGRDNVRHLTAGHLRGDTFAAGRDRGEGRGEEAGSGEGRSEEEASEGRSEEEASEEGRCEMMIDASIANLLDQLPDVAASRAKALDALNWYRDQLRSILAAGYVGTVESKYLEDARELLQAKLANIIRPFFADDAPTAVTATTAATTHHHTEEDSQ